MLSIPTFVDPEEWLFEDGWSYRAEPWPDLADNVSLASADPWRRFLCVFERAKRGDIGAIELLPPILHETGRDVGSGVQVAMEVHRLKYGLLLLIGAVAPDPILRELEPYLAEGTWRDLACDAVRLSGRLSMVEPMLLARRRAFGEAARGLANDALVDLLHDDIEWAERSSDDEVRARARVLATEHGRATTFWRGLPVDVRRIAAAGRALLVGDDEQRWEASYSLHTVLFQLETLTGVPSRGLSRNDPLPPVVTIEAFLADAEAVAERRGLRTGHRAFFGHPI